MPLPPDPDSAVQVIKRAHHQTYLWRRCCERIVDRLPFEGNGWVVERVDEKESEVKPLWFTGSQLPPLPSRKEDLPPVPDGEIADDESDDIEMKSPKRKRRRSNRNQGTRGVEPSVETEIVPPTAEKIIEESNGDSGAEADESELDVDSSYVCQLDEEDSDWERWEEEVFMSNEERVP